MCMHEQAPDIHLDYEKTALKLINQERQKMNLRPLELIDNLTKISNLRIKKVNAYSNLNEYMKVLKQQDIKTILDYYNIYNCKYVFENVAQGYNCVEDAVKSWLKNNDQRASLLNPDMTHFSLSCLATDKTKYWFNIIISKAPDVDVKTLEQYRLEVIDLVNMERAKYDLKPLAKLDAIMNAAQIRAYEQIEKTGHTRPNNSDCFTVLKDINFELKGNYILGENVAQGQLNAKEVVQSWMNSPAHRDNILKPDYDYIGVGAYLDKGKIYWSQFFLKSDI